MSGLAEGLVDQQPFKISSCLPRADKWVQDWYGEPDYRGISIGFRVGLAADR